MFAQPVTIKTYFPTTENRDTRGVETVNWWNTTRHVTCDSVEEQKDVEELTLIEEPITEKQSSERYLNSCLLLS